MLEFNDCPLHFFACFINNIILYPDLPSTWPKERSGQIRTLRARRSGALIYNKVQIKRALCLVANALLYESIKHTAKGVASSAESLCMGNLTDFLP